MHVGGNGADSRAKATVVVARAADQDAGLVGVTRVVDDELDALALLALVADALGERVERAIEGCDVGLAIRTRQG